MIHTKTLVTLAVAIVGLSARAGIIDGPVTNPANGHTYYLLSPGTWSKAEAEAVSLGGHLATVRNVAEDRWLSSTFGSSNGALWIGLTDSRKTRQYTWVSGEPVSYRNWSGGQPDNRPADGGTELYVHLWPGAHTHPGQWNDYSDSDTVLGFPLHGVVEVVPLESVRLSLPVGKSVGKAAAVTNLATRRAANPELHASTAIELSWVSERDSLYQAQWTDSVENPDWKNLGPVLRGTGAVLSTFDSTREHPRAFYRLKLVQ